MTRTVRDRLARGILWNLASAGAGQGSTFVVNIALAHLFGQGGFGVYALALSSVQNLALLAGLAMGYTATRYLAELRVRDPARAGRVIGFCLTASAVAGGLAAVALLGLAPLVAGRVLHDPALTGLLRAAGVTAFIVILNGTLAGILAGLEAYRTLGLANLIAGAVYLGACLAGGWLLGPTGAVGGMLVSAVVQGGLLALGLRYETRRLGIPPRFLDLGRERPIIMTFAVPSALAGVSYAAAAWLGQVMLARTPQGYTQLAGYVAGLNLITLVLFLPNITNTVASSVLNSLAPGAGGSAYRKAFWLNFRMTCLAVGVGAALLSLAGSRVLGLYGPGFSASASVLLFLALGSLPEALTTASYQVLQTRERMWRGLLTVVLPRDALFLAGALAWVPAAGGRGLAGAYLLSRLVGLSLALLAVGGLGPGLGVGGRSAAAVAAEVPPSAP